MLRGWIIFSTLVLSVLFRLFHKYGENILPHWTDVGFLFSEKTLNRESWVYFLMEHINAIGIAAALLIQDSTPRKLLWLYIIIIIADGLHYLLFFRDEGIGFNLAKVIAFGVPIAYFEITRRWTQFKQ